MQTAAASSRDHPKIVLVSTRASSSWRVRSFGWSGSRAPSLRNPSEGGRGAATRVTLVSTSTPARTPARVVLRRAALAALGGTLGTAARLGLGMLIPDAALGVLAANLVGALLLGILTARLPAPDLRILLGTGLLGGFTTYSAFTVDAVGLWGASPVMAAGYVVVSIAGGLAAAALGLRLGRKRAAA